MRKVLFQVLRNQQPASPTEPVPWWSRDSSVNVTSSHSSTHHLPFSSPGDEKVYPCPEEMWAIQQDNDGESGNLSPEDDTSAWQHPSREIKVSLGRGGFSIVLESFWQE